MFSDVTSNTIDAAILVMNTMTLATIHLTPNRSDRTHRVVPVTLALC